MITPARATAIVTLFALAALVVSQFVDYRGVAIGASDYAVFGDVAGVAPPPQRGVEVTGSAHFYVMIPAAVVALLAGIAGFLGRWRLTRLISLIGIGVVIVSFAVDRPAGLDEGEIGITFSDTEAVILDGWYAQLFAGITLIACGLLLAHHLRRQQEAARS